MRFSRSRTIRYTLLVSFGAALALGATTLARIDTSSKAPPDNYGQLVQSDTQVSALYSPPVDVHEGCSIGALGVAPVRKKHEPMDAKWEIAMREAVSKMHEQRLEESQIPPEVVDKLIARLKGFGSTAYLNMGRAYGEMRDGTQLFYPVHTMTYRKGERYAVCKNSRLNFTSDLRTEGGRLEPILDNSGKVYWFGEMYACGNLVRLFPAPQGWNPFAPPLVAPPGYNNPFPIQPPPGHIVQPKLVVNEVPEPGTLALMGIGFVGYLLTRTKK